MNNIPDRIQEVRRFQGMTVSEFALKLEEKRQRIADIEAGRQRAPQEVLAKIVEIFFINGTWLLTGEGEMSRQRSSGGPAQELTPEARDRLKQLGGQRVKELMESHWKRRVEALERELKQAEANKQAYGPVTVGRGPLLDAWPIVGILGASFPQSLTVEAIEAELARRLIPRTRTEVDEHLELLVREGLIVRAGDSYKTSDAVVDIHTRDLSNVSQHATEAARMLFQEILPVVERGGGRGYLLTTGVTVDASSSDDLPRKVMESVQKVCRSVMCESSSDAQELRVVLAVSLRQNGRGQNEEGRDS